MDLAIALVWWLTLYPWGLIGAYVAIMRLRMPFNPKNKYHTRQKYLAIFYTLAITPLLIWATFYYRVPQTLLDVVNSIGSDSSTEGSYSDEPYDEDCDYYRDPC